MTDIDDDDIINKTRQTHRSLTIARESASKRHPDGRVCYAKVTFPLTLDALRRLKIINGHQRNFGIRLMSIRALALRNKEIKENRIYTGMAGGGDGRDHTDETRLVLTFRKIKSAEHKKIITTFCVDFPYVQELEAASEVLSRFDRFIVREAFIALGEALEESGKEMAKRRKAEEEK